MTARQRLEALFDYVCEEHRKQPTDLTRRVMNDLNEALSTLEEKSHSAAQELGKLGGSKGGIARAAKLSPERRSEIARKAVMARWKKGATS